MKTTNRNFLVVLLITTPLFIFSQNSGYGTVRTDGFNKITFGANWSKRPEAKKVFNWNEGMPLPDGVDEIKILQEITFVRFFGNENNGQDINYIAIPIGKKIYRVGNQWYLSDCGNRIEFWNPVSTELKETIVEKKQTESFISPDKWTPPQNLGQAVMSMPAQNVSAPQFVVVKTKTWFGRNWPWIAAAAAASATTTILVVKNQHHSNVVIEDRTMPDGLPAKGTTDGTGLDSDPRGMPGGG